MAIILKNIITEELLNKARQNDAAASRQLWNICWPIVFNVCTRMLDNEFIATEVSVEALTQFIIKYIHSIEHAEAVRTYVQLIAVRLAIKERRRQQRRSLMDMDELAAATTLNLEERANYKLLIPRLESCLAKLSPKTQKILKLRFFRGMTNPDIGNLVGASKQYIGRVLSKSISTLRKCIERPRTPQHFRQSGSLL
ncbi:MAG: sigma-70 family RNA polymerase sigma factor [Deltaproteobacteria bacterium]|nr:sigma-70 family RNA polymerase sigma factor [Deltaproteobacteria bacterium]